MTHNYNAERISTLARWAIIGRLSASLFHEINNPMAVILGFCDLLLEKTKKGTHKFTGLDFACWCYLYSEYEELSKTVLMKNDSEFIAMERLKSKTVVIPIKNTKRLIIQNLK